MSLTDIQKQTSLDAVTHMSARAAEASTAAEVHEICISYLHASAAVFVGASSVVEVAGYLRQLADAIEANDAKERRAAMN